MAASGKAARVNGWRRILRSPAVVALGAASAVFGLLLGMRVVGVLEPLELAWYDLQLQRTAEDAIREPPIVLVLIHEEDIRRFGHPLPDDLLRQLLQRILAANPRAVGVDLYRDQPVPIADGDPAVDTEAYRALGRVVIGDPRIVMTMKFPDPGRQGTPPPRFLSSHAQVGFSDLPIDPGGTVRRGLLFMWDGDTALFSFALQLATRYLAADRIKVEPDPENDEQVMLGPTVIPPFHRDQGPYVGADDAGYQFLLDYRLGSRGFETRPLPEVLSGDFDPARFTDRIVLVGTAAPSVEDTFFTPLSRARPAGERAMYGVEVHGHAIDQLLRYAAGESRPLASPTFRAYAVWLALWCVLGAGLGMERRLPWLSVAGGVLFAVGLVVGAFLLFERGTWVPVMTPLLGLFGSASLGVGAAVALERSERRQLLGLFSRFQGAEVADEIWRRREEFAGAGGRPATHTLVLTALLADLEGYSGVSEKLAPEQLMEWVNEYLSAMARLVHRHGGVVDDYAGDAIKASFGFPIPHGREEQIGEDAAAAVRCALEMGREVERLNERWREQGLPESRCRVGIFTGEVVVGYIGSDRALKYTSVGDTVNSAKRLEEFRKEEFQAEQGESAWRVLVGAETMRRARGHGRFEATSLGVHSIRGKDETVEIFRVTGEREPDRG